MRVTERLSTFSTRTSAADDLNLMLGESAQLITVNVVVRRDTLALRNVIISGLVLKAPQEPATRTRHRRLSQPLDQTRM